MADVSIKPVRLYDSDGDAFGEGLGRLISSESDYLNQKYKNRLEIKFLKRPFISF